jgi:hypothetical protein
MSHFKKGNKIKKYEFFIENIAKKWSFPFLLIFLFFNNYYKN